MGGSIKFLAPEIWKQERNYSHEIDWFSLGIVTGEMLSETLIFKPKKNEDTEKGTLRSEIEQWRNCLINDDANLDAFKDEEMRDLIKGLVEKDPITRISSVSDLKQEKIFTNFDWTLQAIKSNDYVKTFIEKYASDSDYKFMKNLAKPFSNFSAAHNFVADSAKKEDPKGEI